MTSIVKATPQGLRWLCHAHHICVTGQKEDRKKDKARPSKLNQLFSRCLPRIPQIPPLTSHWLTLRSPPITAEDTAMCLVQYKSLLLRRKWRRHAWVTSGLCHWARCYCTRDVNVGGNQHTDPTLNEDPTASDFGTWHLCTWFKALPPFFKTLPFFEAQLIQYDTLRKSLPTTLCPTSHSLFFLLVCFSHPL